MKRDSREPDAGEDREAFLSRWSRRKEDARQAPPPAAKKDADAGAPAPALPPVDKLTIDSDYRDFFHPKVGEDVRRSALKKLFGDPHFNLMDGLDVYIDDYSKTEPIPPAMLAGLRQARNIFQWAREDSEQREKERLAREGKVQAPSPHSKEPARLLEPPAAPSGPVAGARSGVPAASPDAEGTEKP